MAQGYDSIILVDIFPQKLWSRTIGPYRIANELRSHGYSCKVINGFTDFSAEELLKLVESFVGDNTVMLGFSCTFVNTPSSKGYYKSARSPFPDSLEIMVVEFKKRYPHIKIVVGGSTASNFALKTADAYVFGYGEESVVSLMQSLKEASPVKAERRGDYLVMKSQNEKLDFAQAATFYTEEDAVMPGECLPLELTRGCRFRCKFCSYPMNGRAKNDYYKDKEVVRRELLDNFEKWGTTSYILGDDTFNESVEKLEYYNEVFCDLPFQIQYTAYVRLDLIHRNPRMTELLLKGGIRGAFFGIETFFEPASRAIGKGMTREQSMALLRRIRTEWGNDVLTSGGFIVGLPHETKDTVTEWLELILSGEVPLHNHQANPLLIKAGNQDEVWLSEFERQPEKYGYKVTVTGDPEDNRGIYWESPTMNSRDAKKIVQDYTQQKVQQHVRFDCFSHAINLGYGLTHEQSLKLNVCSQEDNQMMDALVLKRIGEYKSKIALPAL